MVYILMIETSSSRSMVVDVDRKRRDTVNVTSYEYDIIDVTLNYMSPQSSKISKIFNFVQHQNYSLYETNSLVLHASVETTAPSIFSSLLFASSNSIRCAKGIRSLLLSC